MKRSAISAGLALLLTATGIALFGLGVWRQAALTASSEEYAISVSVAISNEGPDRLLQEASAEYRQQRSALATRKSFDFVSSIIGQVELIESVSGGAMVPLYYFSEELPVADYAFVAKLQQGTADIEISLVYREERWQVTRYSVVSNLLSD